MAEAETQTDTDQPKKKNIKALIMVAGLLAIEAVAIVGAMALLGGPPDVAAANEFANAEEAEEQKIVEVLVLDAKLPNAKAGVTYLYDSEIYVHVKKKHAERVADELDQYANEIKAEMGAIWRTSAPSHFKEPKLENLTRKVYAMLQERFGVDQDDSQPILVKCVIVMGTGFRIDS